MNISFKGYDAVPLKALHISQSWGKINDEFDSICKKEGIECKPSKFNGSYNQDVMVITNKDGKSKVTMAENVEFMKPFLKEMEKEYGMPVELLPVFGSSSGYLQGGNYFLGKKSDGSKFMLIGAKDKWFSTESKIAKRYDVDKKDIHYISQQDYHLDLCIRPIGYPYVLVNNPQMALKTEAKAKGLKPKMASVIDKNDMRMNAYKDEIKQLQNAGFVPIPVGGVFELDTSNVNFMNAIVNKHDDGSISYITNSSKCDNKTVSKYQKIFENELRTKLDELRKTDPNVPVLRDVYFVEGENYGDCNEVMSNLLEGAGGVHCMTAEEPDFERWV